jgi:putative transposase
LQGRVTGEPQADPAAVVRGGPAPPGPDPQRRRVAGVTRTAAAERRTSLAIDFQFDETAGGRRLKLASIVDEHTREALAIRVARTCGAHDLVEVLTARRC